MKRLLTATLGAIFFLSGIGYNGITAQAEEVGTDINYSYLLTDDALIGYIGNQTRGLYLLSGESIINKISSTKIGAGGTTTAALKCKVAVTSIVERQNNSGQWVHVASWTNSVESGYTAIVSKSLTVGTGYYYRVRSTHYASSDVSTSCTSSLKM